MRVGFYRPTDTDELCQDDLLDGGQKNDGLLRSYATQDFKRRPLLPETVGLGEADEKVFTYGR